MTIAMVIIVVIFGSFDDVDDSRVLVQVPVISKSTYLVSGCGMDCNLDLSRSPLC